MDSLTYPTWYSGIGQIVGSMGHRVRYSNGQSHLSYIIHWQMTGFRIGRHGIPTDSTHLSYIQYIAAKRKFT